jgi:hypothetical protein
MRRSSPDGFGFGVSVALEAVGILASGDLVTGKYSICGTDERVPNILRVRS